MDSNRKQNLEDSFVSESSSLFPSILSNASHPKFVESEHLNSVLRSNSLSKRRRSWPPGSPKDHSNSDNHGIFVTCDDETEDFVGNGFSNKGYLNNSFRHNDVLATRSLATKIPKIRRVQRPNRLRPRSEHGRRSRKSINNNVAERVSLFKALVHVDGENSSNGIGSEASRGMDEAVSIGGDVGNGNYQFLPKFDDMLMEHSCGSVRALAVEAAFVANGILRRAQHGKLGSVVQDDGNSAGTVASRATVISAKTLRKRRIANIFQHYYPEGGWGYVILLCGFLVQIFTHGLQLSFGIFLPIICHRFRISDPVQIGWLGATSTCLSLLISPITIGICRRKSTRLTAVFGGLITALGCLFTSFASQFHQLFISYGIMIGIGVGMARDPAALMVGQYFKRKRELVEIVLVSGSGLGITVMSLFIKESIGSIGWRLGMQSMTGVVLLSFLLGTFYRSASLYHPQRRAILHLKSQKRKIKNKDKEKNKIQDDAPPFFDFTCLRSRTIQILLLSIFVASIGLNTTFFFMVLQANRENITMKDCLMLQIYLGLSWSLGCVVFGSVVVNNSAECKISRLYLCQISMLMCGITVLAFAAVDGFRGYVVFVWCFGVFSGGFIYSLKMYIYEKVRARNFSRAWGFAQFSMALPTLFGVTISEYVNSASSGRGGYVFSGIFIVLGSLVMFFIKMHKSNIRRKRKRNCRERSESRGKHRRVMADTVSIAPDGTLLGIGGVPIAVPTSPESNSNFNNSGVILADSGHSRSGGGTISRFSHNEQDDILFPPPFLQQPQLSLSHPFLYNKDLEIEDHDPDDEGLSDYSDEEIPGIDIPDNILLDDFEFADNITSCNKVENCLMLSEYEQNLSKEKEWGPLMGSANQKRNRKWSLFRQSTLHTINSEPEELTQTQIPSEQDVSNDGASSSSMDPKYSRYGRENISFFGTNRKIQHNRPKREITVIEENSSTSTSEPYASIS